MNVDTTMKHSLRRPFQRLTRRPVVLILAASVLALIALVQHNWPMTRTSTSSRGQYEPPTEFASLPTEQTVPNDAMPAVPGKPLAAEIFPRDLTNVPEVHFQDPQTFVFNKTENEVTMLRSKMQKQIDNIRSINQAKADHFMEMLCAQRNDLAGLPFVLGEACRLGTTEREQFARAVMHIRESLRLPHDVFWSYLKAPENPPGIAALTQILALEPSLLPGLIDRLASYDGKEATEALARLAIFTDQERLRQRALAKLQKRDTAPATAILRKGSSRVDLQACKLEYSIVSPK